MNREKEYLLNRVESASAVELITILYETGLQSTQEALDALRAGDVLKRGHAINKATQVLFELQASLRHDVQKEYSSNLAALYSYMQRQLSRAHVEKSAAMLEEVARLLGTLLDGWYGASKALSGERPAQSQPEPPAQKTAASAPHVGVYATDSRPERSWSL